ncbi:MAG TPA: Calx-beta domain-containing protein [Candidatus Paceibacterota bacterium]|nr:Calx-beta domain-containing protein [Verrucomicrobiota bacterium]HRZ44597.1 Calx-beta domain-containing protein [Candidatus Paceibacterota bacterium]
MKSAIGRCGVAAALAALVVILGARFVSRDASLPPLAPRRAALQPQPVRMPSSAAPESPTSGAAQGEAPPSAPALDAQQPQDTPSGAWTAFNGWLERFRAAEDEARTQLENEGIARARARRAAMRDLIVRDPRAALRAALPPAARSGLPAEIASLLEEPISARGDLNVLFASPRPGQESSCSEPVIRTVQLPGRFYYAYTYGRRRRQMSTPASSIIGIAVDDRLALQDQPYRVLDAAEAAVLPDREILASGFCPVCGQALPERAGDAAFVDIGGSLMALHSPVEAPSLFTAPDGTIIWAAGGSGGTGKVSPVDPETSSQGNKRFLFTRVRFADDDPAYEPETDAQVRGDLNTVVRRFAEQSYGSLQGSYAFTPTLTLPKPRSGYMNGWSDTDGMTALLNDAKARAAAIASDPAFPGVPYPYRPADYSLFAVRWNGEPGGCCSYGGGGNAWIRWDGASVLIHEWGHAVGLPHANWWNPSTDDPIGPGTHEEYGNSFDNMGSGGIEEDYGAMHKALVKWLPSTHYWTVTNSGVYRIHAHDQPALLSTNRYGLKVFRASRDDTHYWLEHRAYTVSGANAQYWTHGVAVTREWEWELLDMTPGSSKGKSDCTLTVGRTWSDAAAGLHYTAVARGDTPLPWVDVAVNFDDDSSPNHPPSAVVVASSYAVGVGANVSLSAIAADPDADTLAYAWDFGDGSISVNNRSVQTRSWSVAGTYMVQCTVSDLRGGACVQSIAIKIGTPADYSISGRVTARDGSPMAMVRITEPSGKAAWTDSDGAFVLGPLSAGSYTLSAVRNGFTFAPPSRTIAVGPNVMGADFVSPTRAGPGSGLEREVWLNISGSAVPNLTANARYPDHPDQVEALADAFESPLDWQENYGQRVRGYFVPPISGGYTFYIASDDASELYLSPTTNAASKARIAYVSGWTDSRSWSANPSQRSSLFQLAAGQRYYIEALQKEGNGGDHLAVGVDLPDGTQERPVPYHRLVPLDAPSAPPIAVSIAASVPTTAEGGEPGAFTFDRTGDAAAPLEVFFRVSGSARYAADYAGTGLKITFAAGQTNASISIAPINDTAAETAETVTLTLVAGTGYIPSPGADSATVAIHDNDGSLAVSIVATGPNASKEGPEPGRFTVQRSGIASDPVRVRYTIAGTATNGVDYGAIDSEVVFEAGQATADIMITPLAGAGLEPPKTVVLTLVAGSGYVVAAPNMAKITIAQPGPGLGLLREWWTGLGGAGTVSELTNSGGFPDSPSGREFLRSAAEGPRDWEDNYGSRLRGWFIAPMTGSYSFFIASDDGGELWLGTSSQASSRRRIAYVSGWVDYRAWTSQANQRSAGVPLVAGQRYYLEALHSEGSGGDHCSIGVQFPNGALERPITAQWLEPWTDRSAIVAISASVPLASEGGTPGEFTLRRTGDPGLTLAVGFSVSGTAASGSDYGAVGVAATFPPGSRELRIPVRAVLDAAIEGPETVTLALKTSANYQIGFADSATVTIVGDPPRATVTAPDAGAGESGGNPGMFRIALPVAAYGPVTFRYALEGTAAPGADYAVLPGSVTLAAGQIATNIVLAPLTDDYTEGPETVVLILKPGDGYIVGASGSAAVTIADANANRPPVFGPIPDRTIFAGQILAFTNSASDPDLPPQTITFNLVSAPPGMALDEYTGLLRWRPHVAESPMTTQVLLSATDSGSPGLSVTQSFWITVNRPAAALEALSLEPGGFVFRVTGDPGPDLTIQRSADLADWIDLLRTNSPALPFDWVDPGAASRDRTFYRIHLTP